MEKTTEQKKPNRPLSMIYADAKQAITRQVGNTMAAYGLPIFMAEGILSGILAEIRTNAANELADDTARYEDEWKEYYESARKEMQEAHEKEKADLILAFENPDLPGATPEGEPEPAVEQELDSEEVVVEEKYAGGEPMVEEVE